MKNYLMLLSVCLASTAFAMEVEGEENGVTVNCLYESKQRTIIRLTGIIEMGSTKCPCEVTYDSGAGF